MNYVTKFVTWSPSIMTYILGHVIILKSSVSQSARIM